MQVKVAGDPDRDGNDVPAGSTGTWRRLYLLRHGEAACFGPDGLPADPSEVSLTAHGRAQADGLAAALLNCGAQLLVASAVPRAIETAAILAAGIAASHLWWTQAGTSCGLAIWRRCRRCASVP